MNFLGVGLPEMLVIFAVALLVFGPRKLPEIGRTLAKTLRSLQDASREFEAQLNREAQELEKAVRPAAARTQAESVATANPPGKPANGAEPVAATADNSPTADAA
ncbi:TatA/E family twin arginine-targeting protein translocase [Synechococcus sp. H55.11]|uniref:TatA/E family twin arginine-targeting protein translocase n=1 Tax=Synechococcus sp. H55.11 TaxID=2967121 RepID=UPI0039C19C1A